MPWVHGPAGVPEAKRERGVQGTVAGGGQAEGGTTPAQCGHNYHQNREESNRETKDSKADFLCIDDSEVLERVQQQGQAEDQMEGTHQTTIRDQGAVGRSHGLCRSTGPSGAPD